MFTTSMLISKLEMIVPFISKQKSRHDYCYCNGRQSRDKVRTMVVTGLLDFIKLNFQLE